MKQKLKLVCITILTINIDNELLTPYENRVQLNINLFYAVINGEKVKHMLVLKLSPFGFIQLLKTCHKGL